MPSLTPAEAEILAEIKNTLDASNASLEDRFVKLETDLRTLKQRGLLQLPGRGSVPDDARNDLAGRKFVTSDAFKAWAGSPGQRGRVAVGVPLNTKAATNIITTEVAPAGTVRLPDIAAPMFPPPGMLSLLPTRPTTGDKVSYLRLKSRPTPGARSQFPEASTKAEQSFDIAPYEVAIATIAAWTSATTQALADLTQLERFIDTTLTMLVLDETDRQSLLGTGAAAGELDGLIAQATPYTTAATQTGDTVLDVLSHAQLQLASAGVIATAAVVGPGDAEKARLTKATDGSYILQQPTVGALPNLWSMSIVVDIHMPANTFLVGRFLPDSIELLDRQSALVEASREHADYFTRNLVALRCELRAALAVYWPAAFVTGTFPVSAPGVMASSKK